MKAFATLLLLIIGLSFSSLASNEPVVAQNILDKLWKASGNYQHFKKPVLELSDDTTIVAGYYPHRNKIVLERKAFKICQSFGEESSSALAYILGHELAHVFQEEIKHISTNFLSYNQHIKASIRHEKTADIQGVLNAYLSGYKIQTIVPRVIAEIYSAYDLMDDPMPGYPSFQERRQAAEEVQKIVDRLVQVYETANYLIAMGQYSLAIHCYNHILGYYENREIYNNIGLSYMLQAMNFTRENVDSFLYPVELDWSTRLRKPQIHKDQELSLPDQWKRNHLLQTAEEKLLKASGFTDGYMTAEINLLCVYSLTDQADLAIQYIKDNELFKKARRLDIPAKQYERLRLAVAINYAQSGKAEYQEQARNILEDLGSDSTCQYNADQALMNLNILQGHAVKSYAEHNCSLKFQRDQQKIRPPAKFDQQLKLTSEVNLQMHQTEEGSVVKIWDEKDQYGVLLKRSVLSENSPILQNSTFPQEGLASTSGVIYHCPEQNLLLHDMDKPELVLYKTEQVR